MIHVLGCSAVKPRFLSVECVELFSHSQFDFHLHITRSAVTMTFVTSGASADFDHCFQILFCIAFHTRLFIVFFQNNSPFHVIDRYWLRHNDNDKRRLNRPRPRLRRQARPVCTNKFRAVYKSSLPFLDTSFSILAGLTYWRLFGRYDTYSSTPRNRLPIRSCPPVPFDCRSPFPAAYKPSSSFLSPPSTIDRCH